MGLWEEVASFFAEHLPEVITWRQAPRDIEELYADKNCRPMTEKEFNGTFKSAGPGYQWHHILERNSGLPESEVWNPCNVIRVPTVRHWRISDHYSSRHESGMTVRMWLRTRPLEEQRAYGLGRLRKEGVIK